MTWQNGNFLLFFNRMITIFFCHFSLHLSNLLKNSLCLYSCQASCMYYFWAYRSLLVLQAQTWLTLNLFMSKDMTWTWGQTLWSRLSGPRGRSHIHSTLLFSFASQIIVSSYHLHILVVGSFMTIISFFKCKSISILFFFPWNVRLFKAGIICCILLCTI